MEYLIIILKCVVSLSILNVWLLRFNKSTPWRGGEANSLLEEFHAYGLPTSFAYTVGVIKVGLALLLIVSIFWDPATLYAAGGIILTMTGAIVMHLKVMDPLKKSLPAFIFLLISAFIFFSSF
ncbi:DoxX family protein [Aureitalea sp. L0-47]|uniref:DoxX family protein n=1 Tax=Aureitalea sp. L0-47 TaxID=2816962 RepID=UPI002237729F|nr:DoxX family protein [Aureitalea sp. L0-47]MCW5518523.1 DoxX family protein [Aureitalea sp. L0-47]